MRSPTEHHHAAVTLTAKTTPHPANAIKEGEKNPLTKGARLDNPVVGDGMLHSDKNPPLPYRQHTTVCRLYVE